MKILKVDPGELPQVTDIDDSLEAMQSIVGGMIQAVYPFEEPVALICNDEGKLLGLPYNRTLRDRDGKIYDIICGTFFLCTVPPGSDRFSSLTPEQIAFYADYYKTPEFFLKTNHGIAVLHL